MTGTMAGAIRDRGTAAQARFERRCRIATLVLAAAALLLYLLQIGAPRSGNRPLIGIAADLSASVDSAALRTQLARLEEAPFGDPVVVGFASRAVTASTLGALGQVELVDGAGEPGTALDRSATNLEEALDRVEIELLRRDPQRRRPWRVLLVSDGLETRGGTGHAIARLLARGVPVDAIALGTATGRDAVVGIRTRGEAVAGAPLLLEIDATSSAATNAEIAILIDGEAVSTVDTRLEPGSSSVEVSIPIDSAGLHEVTALRLDPSAPAGGLGLRTGLVAAEPAPILLVADPGATATFERALRGYGWRMERVAPRRLPTAAAAYSRWAAVVLADVDANTLGPHQMSALRSWVVGGGGLVFTSGPSTFGEDGYSETPIEQILPMRFNLEEERADVALMIALDKSYSMRGEKIELAKEAAKAVVGELQETHRFGLVAFDWNPYRVVPLQFVREPERLFDSIRRIEASAQTNFYPALESCFEQLQSVEAKVKHVILISDGRTYPDDYEKLIGEMRAADITVSTVGVGEEADRQLLASIASWGDGESYYVQDARRVQQILLEEARARTEDTVVEEQTPVTRAATSAALRGLDLAALPPLSGYVTLEANERALILLEAIEEDQRPKPILGRRNVGLGRTWMFAADLGARWATDWLSEPVGAQLFSRVLRDAAGERDRVRLELNPPYAPTDLVLHGPDLTAPSARLSPVAGGDASATALALHQTAPGVWRAEWPSPLTDHRVVVFDGDRPVAVGAVLAPSTLEHRPALANVDRLRQITERTGGVFSPTDEQLVRPGNPQPWRMPVWPFFAGGALLTYLAELTSRRAGWLLLRPSASARHDTPGTDQARATVPREQTG